MTREDMTQEAYDALLDAILGILMKKGLKATKMDYVAVVLQMSKRTLYEIFDSKINMIVEAVNRFHYNLRKNLSDFEAEGNNPMACLIISFVNYRRLLEDMNVDFLKDFDEGIVPGKDLCARAEKEYFDLVLSILDRCVAEGYIRSDINYLQMFRIAQVQLALLKHLKELFPDGITEMQVYDNNTVMFLRGVATPKGITEIDRHIRLFPTIREVNSDLHEANNFVIMAK